MSSVCHVTCFLKLFHFLDQSWEEDADNRFFFHLLDKSKVMRIQWVVVVVVVGLHPMTHVGSLRMCLDPDVVPPLAGFLLVAVLGVLHHILSVVSVCVFETG